MTSATDRRDVAFLREGSRDGLREMAALLAATDPSALSAMRRADDVSDFTETREEIFDILARTARLVAALAGEGALGIREVTVQAPAPWRRRTLVRADVDTSQGEDTWGEPDERLARHAPDMPCMVDFSVSDGFVEARGWSVHAMILRSPPPDSMEILRESVSIRNRLDALAREPHAAMDAQNGVLHTGGRTDTSEAE